MGDNRWGPDDWAAYAASHTKGRPIDAVFSATHMHEDLNPRSIQRRESVDSPNNPASTPVIVALDVTGSMGRIPHNLVQGNLGTLMEELIARRPISDPHLMFMGVGDVAAGDRAPLQVTQFEADVRIADQLRQIYIERGGGSNSYESYHLPWYFAATKTSIDSMPKRNQKGYLFTVGDEQPPPGLTRAQIEKVFGTAPPADLSTADLLEMAERNYHVFHIMIEEGDHFRSHGEATVRAWRDLMGQRAIRLSDHRHLAEVIVSTIQAHQGADRAAVSGSWTGDTAMVVARALSGMPEASANANAGGLVSL